MFSDSMRARLRGRPRLEVGGMSPSVTRSLLCDSAVLAGSCCLAMFSPGVIFRDRSDGTLQMLAWRKGYRITIWSVAFVPVYSTFEPAR